MDDWATAVAALAALSALTIARPRLALYTTFAAIPLQFLFIPFGSFFVSPADAAVLAGVTGLGVRLVSRNSWAWQALREHAWLAAMLAGYLIGFLILGGGSRTLVRVAFAIMLSVLACDLLRNRRQLQRATGVLILAAVIDVLIAAAFYLGDTWLHPHRFAGVGGPNFTAMLGAVATVIAVAKLAQTRRPYMLAAPGVLALGVGATLSKTGALVLIAGAGLVMPLMSRRNVVSLTVAAGLVLSLALSQGTIRQALYERTQPAVQNDGVARSSAELRWWMMVTALWAFGENPMTGIGYGRFQAYSVTHPEIRGATAGVGFGTHNTYLEVLAEGGLMAFVPFLLHLLPRCWHAAVAARRILRTGDVDLWAAVVGFPLVLICAGFNNLLPYYFFWAVTGTASAALLIHRREATAVETPRVAIP